MKLVTVVLRSALLRSALLRSAWYKANQSQWTVQWTVLIGEFAVLETADFGGASSAQPMPSYLR